MSGQQEIATRISYGNALKECADEYPNLVVLDADLAGATKTIEFKKVHPERFCDCGIAEANMIGIAAGLAASGMVPFASTFAMFAAGRAYEQIRNSVAYPKLNVKIGATHAGISVGEDGASHQCLEDIALMRAIPGMTVLCPSDDVEAKGAVKAAIEHDGPVYIRFGRMPVPVLHDSAFDFQIGKGDILKQGTDVSIIATGICTSAALEAAERLEKDGINAEVINICSIKPLDEQLIYDSAKKTGLVVTAEEHSVIGGLGGAVSEYLSTCLPTRIYRIGMNDRFGESGAAKDLVKKYKLDAEGLYTKIKECM